MSGGWRGSDRRARLPRNWAAIRAEVLARDVTCVLCSVRPATHCDHIKPKTDDDRPSQLQGVCEPCHLQKSAREGAAAAKAKGRPSRTRPPEQHPGLL